MAKTVNKQSTPTIEGEEMAEGETQNVVSIPVQGGTRKSLLSSVRQDLQGNVAKSQQIMGEARQRLAEASDLFEAGDSQATQATTVANAASVLLYQGWTQGIVTQEQVSAALGDVFGYKPKSDGTPGKTPAGQGEVIRKRIVRAVQAYEYANGEDASRFYDGLPADEVATVVNGIENGTVPIFTAYDKLADIRKEANSGERLALAFDPKAIGKIVASLSEESAATMLAESEALQVAYAQLQQTLAIVDERAAGIVESEAA